MLWRRPPVGVNPIVGSGPQSRIFHRARDTASSVRDADACARAGGGCFGLAVGPCSSRFEATPLYGLVDPWSLPRGSLLPISETIRIESSLSRRITAGPPRKDSPAAVTHLGRCSPLHGTPLPQCRSVSEVESWPPRGPVSWTSKPVYLLRCHPRSRPRSPAGGRTRPV